MSTEKDQEKLRSNQAGSGQKFEWSTFEYEAEVLPTRYLRMNCVY